jgi:ubiquinone/menaquinone biosynthesis C-methylase UbiE
MVNSGSSPLAALDFGCGSGNLTRHLLDHDVDVTAADVSDRFLALVKKRFSTARLSTLQLNGVDLLGVEAARFDFVAAYSVLHHIPDYLAAVGELARVCRSGGVIFLDHEPTEWYWTNDPAYVGFKAAASRLDWRKFLNWDAYVGKVRRWFDPRYTNEGDIHVWPDDHVEWERVEKIMTAAGCEVVFREDYLLFRREYRRDVFDRTAGLFADMRVMAFRKN